MFSNVFLVSNYEEVRLKLIPGTRWYSSGSIQLIILRVVLDVLAVCHNSVVSCHTKLRGFALFLFSAYCGFQVLLNYVYYRGSTLRVLPVLAVLWGVSDTLLGIP